MIISELNMGIMGILKRAYLREPWLHAYLIYDIVYYPEYTEFYLDIVNDELRGYLLIWRDKGCTAHLVGHRNSLLNLIPASCVDIHVVPRDPAIYSELARVYPHAEAMDFLDMVCTRASFRPREDPRVRRLGINDAEALVKIKEAQGISISLGEALMRLASPHWHYYGAFINGELAAIGTTYLKLPEVWFIGDVYTLPRFRGLGLAKSVVSAITKDALRSGALPVLHVLEDNYPAIRAYRGLGYRVIGLRGRILKKGA